MIQNPALQQIPPLEGLDGDLSHGSASDLLTEYLRISTEDLAVLQIYDDDFEEEDDAGEEPSVSSENPQGERDDHLLDGPFANHPHSGACSRTANVKKPVRRQSLDTNVMP